MMDTNQQPKPPGSAETQGVAGLKQTAADATATAREHVERAGEELRARASHAIETAGESLVAESTAAKDTTASELSRTARALHSAAGDLDAGGPGQSQVPQSLLREAANGLDELARSLHGRSVGEMVGDLSAFGRQNPVAFMGGAALVGFALGRFARASERPVAAADHAARRRERAIGTAHQAPAASPAVPAAKPMVGRTPPVGGATHG
ncbi:MAG: hypothetical protein R3D25_20265 [Geminicoccaceae bacterium]